MFQSSADMDKKMQKQQEVYKRIKLLGTGSYGKAYLVKQVKTQLQFVIKQILMTDMSPQEQQNALRQSKILEALSHPNIVKFKEVYRTSKMRLNIVMEFANGGDLAAKIKQAKKQSKLFSQAQILDWLTQICLGVKHIHDRKIIHRDLKAQNIFLTEDNIVKIGDFGVSRVLQKTIMNARTVVGSPYYLSPEIIQNKPYSFQTDIWSLGALLYQLCSLSPPFTANNLQFLALKIVKGSYTQIPNHYSYELRALIKTMLNTDSSKRPNINKILTSKIMSKRISNFLTQSKRMDQFSHTVIHNKNILENNLCKIAKQRDEKSLVPPPNLIRIQKDMENKSQIYTSNVNCQLEQPTLYRPFTPLIGQQRKGPNNFFGNNKKNSKKNIPQLLSQKQLNLNDFIKIRPSAIQQKIKLPKVNANSSLFDRKSSQINMNKNAELKNYQPKQRPVPTTAFTKKRVQSKQLPLNIPMSVKKDQSKKQMQEVQQINYVVGKWNKPPKSLDKIQPNDKRITPIKKQNLGGLSDIIKTQNVQNKQEKPLKAIMKSESIKRVICPTKKNTCLINKIQPQKGKDKKTVIIPKKSSRKQSVSQTVSKMQIVSEQVKKKAIEQKQIKNKVSKNKSTSKFDKEKKRVLTKKNNVFSNNKKVEVHKGTNIKKPANVANKKPNIISKVFDKLAQPPRLQQYLNNKDGDLSPDKQQFQNKQEQEQIVEEQKCDSQTSQDQHAQEMYSHEQFQEYDGELQAHKRYNSNEDEQYYEQIGQDEKEQRLSLNLSDSCKPQQHKKQQLKNKNYNQMLEQLQNIQKMVSQANGIIQTLPIFGDELNGNILFELSLASKQVIRQDDSQLDSIYDSCQDGLKNGNDLSVLPINDKEQTQSNFSQSSTGQTNTNFTILSNQQHLETLKMNLEQLFGEGDIIFIHKFLSQIIQKEGLDFCQKDIQKIIMFQKPQINHTLLKKYFRLIVTVIIMEQQQNQSHEPN